LTERLAAIELGKALAYRPLFLDARGVHAGAARLDIARDFSEFFLILLRPGFHLLQYFLRRRTHSFLI
jgi:hypothetical protein